MRYDADIHHLNSAIEHLQRSCCTRTMEQQSSIAPERDGLIVQQIPAVAKDIFVWIVPSVLWRRVKYFNRAV